MANRQEIVCTYIYENYVASGRLRHDVISNKVQIFTPNGLACPETLRWRDITTADVNDIVCDCSAGGDGGAAVPSHPRRPSAA